MRITVTDVRRAVDMHGTPESIEYHEYESLEDFEVAPNQLPTGTFTLTWI